MHEERQSAEPAPARMREMASWQIARVAARAHRLLADAFEEAGVRGYQYRLLVALDEFGPLSQVSLSNRTGIDRSDVVAALNELESRGAVERQPDAKDRRRNLVTITVAGGRELRKLNGVVDGVQERLLAPLSASERKRLMGLLSGLLDES